MRLSPAILFLATVVVFSAPSALFADDATNATARREARRDLEIAKMELRHYWQIEYPRKRRELNAAIELTQAEIDNYKARLHAYWPFDRYSTGEPFLITLQEMRMCLREMELRLRELWAERNALVRFHADQWRMLEINAFEARLRVAQLEADQEAAPAVEAPPL